MWESIIIQPLMGILALLIIPREKINLLWKVGLEWAVLILTGSMLLWLCFDRDGPFQVVKSLEWISSGEPGFSFIVLGVDGVSIYFILLTALLIPICVLISWNSIRFLIKEFLICLLFIELLLMGVFIILDLVGFYILFEGVLIPMFLIIGIWGSREDKIQASYYFFFYTFIGSVFMLLGIFLFYSYVGSSDYQTLCCLKIERELQYLVFLGFFLSLAIKIPKMPFHIWLPQAHVEAPVAGSVILAGVLLKLGGYGFMRFSWCLFPEASEYFGPLIMTLSIFAIIYGSLITCRQVDLKRIIAYSSVAHMGLVTLGLFSYTVQGLVAAVFLMLAHGLVSSALFIAVTFIYDRYHTRLIKYYRGMAVTMPLFSLFLLILILANASIPLSCNFIGEFYSLLAAFEYSMITGLFASGGIVLSAVYSLYMYNRICFGVSSKHILFLRDLSRKEYFSLLPLVVLIVLMGVFPFLVVDVIKGSIKFIY